MKTRVKRPNPFPFSDSNKRYHTYDYYLRHKYGKKCVTVPLDGGFSCPNIDGTISYGGCTFCSARGSGDFCAPSRLTLAEQFEVAKRLTADKWGRDVGYIPYFQAFSATHGDFDHMRTQMETAAALPGAVALHLATRPDCLPPKVVHYLASLAVWWWNWDCKVYMMKRCVPFVVGIRLQHFWKAIRRCGHAAWTFVSI